MFPPKIRLKLKALLIACPEGGFTSFCPQIKGAISQGETEDEALANLVDAIEELVEVQAEIAEPPVPCATGRRSEYDLVVA